MNPRGKALSCVTTTCNFDDNVRDSLDLAKIGRTVGNDPSAPAVLSGNIRCCVD